VLVHGSGPEDRDESIGPNKTFKDLALGLASRGIAVLRYDKLSQVYGKQPAKLLAIKQPTVKDEVIDDALAAVAWLRKDRHIDQACVVVLGHSLGGSLAPRIGAADSKIAGLISMAGNTRKLADAMLAQSTYLVAASGPTTPDGQKQIDDMKALVARVNKLTPADVASEERISGAPVSYWPDLDGYDPIATAKSITQPMLFLQGERDYQVTFADDFAAWKAGLVGRPRTTFHSYPALNHLFLPGTGQSLPNEYNTPGHVPEEVVRDIAEWLGSICRK
jgi:dienelactone hydrolase